jgi:hypothetical protein
MNQPSENPYAPPIASALAEGRTALFTPKQLAVGTFAGGLLSGVLLFTLNELWQQRGSRAILTFVGGILITLLVMNAPDAIPGTVWTVATTFAAFQYGKMLELGRNAPHPRRSNWLVAGIAIPGLVFTLGFALAWEYGLTSEGFDTFKSDFAID